MVAALSAPGNQQKEDDEQKKEAHRAGPLSSVIVSI